MLALLVTCLPSVRAGIPVQNTGIVKKYRYNTGTVFRTGTQLYVAHNNTFSIELYNLHVAHSIFDIVLAVGLRNGRPGS